MMILGSHGRYESLHASYLSSSKTDDVVQRGVIFHGPAGNGKTISIKGRYLNPTVSERSLIFLSAIMNNLANRKVPIPLLYVKSANTTYAIRSVFATARAFAPCLLILEDIDTIVTPYTRSYFFNEADGLERNDGIMMIASTNHRKAPPLLTLPTRAPFPCSS